MAMQRLAQTLLRLGHLSEVHLCFPEGAKIENNCHILTDKVLDSLGSLLKSLNLTTLLSLKFSNSKLLTEKGFDILVDKSKHMSHVTDLTLNI